MKKLLILSFFLLAGIKLSAQTAPARIELFKDRNYLSVPAADLTNAEPVDTSRLEIRYRFSYQKEGWNKLRWVDVPTTLQIGARWSKFFPDILLTIDRERTASGLARATLSPRIWTIYGDLAGERFVSQHRIPCSSEAVLVEYPEEAGEQKWELDGTSECIAGYTCPSATAVVGGRSWRVWFAPEIPAPANLWLFRGLPGLVLKAQTELFRFVCTAIAERREPILRLGSDQTTTREKWRRYERYFHEEPYDAFSRDGSCVFYDENRKLTRDNWKIEYLPIELE